MGRESRKLRILLTNDDGYYSDGLCALYDELSKNAEVMLVAPDREQSASSHSLTLHRPLRMHRLDKNRYCTDGTPTDCIMLALHLIYKKKHPDFIVSGINHGANMGEDITYSGTVAAAIEGAILKIPSIAVSMARWSPGMKMRNGARFMSRLIKAYPSLALPESTFLNINLPPDDSKAYRSYEFTSQGSRQYKDIVVKKVDPRGRDYFWIAGHPKWRKRKGTDFEAVSRGLVSITPMKLEFTDDETLDSLQSHKGRI